MKSSCREAGAFAILLHKCIHKFHGFRPVFASPMFEIPLLHTLVALVVSISAAVYVHVLVPLQCVEQNREELQQRAQHNENVKYRMHPALFTADTVEHCANGVGNAAKEKP